MNNKARDYIEDAVSKGCMDYDDMPVPDQCELASIVFHEASNTERSEWLLQSDFVDNFLDNLAVALIKDNNDNRQDVMSEATAILTRAVRFKAAKIFRDVIEDFEEDQQRQLTREFSVDIGLGNHPFEE